MSGKGNGKDGRNLADVRRQKQLMEGTEVINVLRDVKVKDRLEEKAFSALERRLEPRPKMCKSCKGEGSRSDGDNCYMCQGEGYVMEDADMRAIELVLSPKFPKTQVNVNAELEGMTTDGLLDLIEGM